MRTTIAVDTTTRDRLVALQARWRAPNADVVVRRLLEGEPLGAKALYERHREAVDAVLRKHGITRLVAFGSRARGDARPDSDLDLAGSMPPEADLFDLARARDDLEKAFGVDVQLITLGGVRGRLAGFVHRDGVVLVE